jgi:predicted  nucleic acid-binding Zn-ribbon protein
MHKCYEELCALAATGQIGAADRAILEDHLCSCAECQAFLSDISEVNVRGIPILAAKRAWRAQIEAPLGMRDRFLDCARANGIQVNPGPALAENSAPSKGPELDVLTGSSRLAWRSGLRLRPMEPFYGALTAAACLVVGFLGYLLALERRPVRPETPSLVATDRANSASSSTSKSAAEEEEKDQLEQEVRRISVELAKAEAQKQELATKLAAATEKAAAGDRLQQEFRQKTKEFDDADAQITSLKSELLLTQQKQSELEAILVAQQQAAQDANAKFANAEFELERERGFQSARGEISELISARDLHIVDVHESEPGGKRQRAFGRVFYVEGQSLVFYAYDLAPSSHPERKLVFHVWGETAGVKDTTHSLGILHSDNPTEARWVLTFDDPKILNRINAVYITAERDSLSKRDPQARKLLYAFLGSPNHP